jgi:hypothetical protein
MREHRQDAKSSYPRYQLVNFGNHTEENFADFMRELLFVLERQGEISRATDEGPSSPATEYTYLNHG